MVFDNPTALGLLALVLPIVVIIGLPRTPFRYRRDSISLILRVVIVTLLILALAGLSTVNPTSRLSIVYALDMSDSMGATAHDNALTFIQDSLRDLPPDDLAGVIVFGDEAFVARNMSNSREGLDAIQVVPRSSNTNYANAIRLALAILPPDTNRRIVILSDGVPTDQNWQAATQLANISNVEISYVPFSQQRQSEVAVQAIDVPTALLENQTFTLTATLYSQQPTDAIITILTNGEIVHRQTIQLEAGQTPYPVRMNSGTLGFRNFEVRVEPLGADQFSQNNRLSAFSRVDGNPKILIVDGDGQAQNLTNALNDLALNVDIITPQQLPTTLSDLIAYRSVILSNVSALTLSSQTMTNLASYVRDLGGGLIVIGGDQSYALGGYAQTPLEDILPVEMKLDDEQRLPSLTIAYLLDRSGSMTALTPSGFTWLDVAKEAIIRSIDALNDQDRIGVASFDTGAIWLTELQTINNRQLLQQQILAIAATGGTNIRAGMELVGGQIIHEPSTIKHIILLTDGGAPRENLPELSLQLYEEHGVTTTIISIGARETNFLMQMAENSGGNYYHVLDATSIPLILATEPALISRSYIQEAETPLSQRSHPILDGISPPPALLGYVATTPRDTATLILTASEPHQDPILATWQYGLGRTVAFTSDSHTWAQNWLNWDDFAPFWGQVVRWSITEGITNSLEANVIFHHNQPVIGVTARDLDGGFLNELSLQANVITMGDQASQTIPLHQVAPGYYEAEFDGDDEGVYLLAVYASDGTVMPAPIIGWVRGYSKEYDVQPLADDILATIANATGGQDLSLTPEALFSPPDRQIRTYESLWKQLLLAAIILLPFDIAVRRLVITSSDLQRLRAWLTRQEQPADHQAHQRLSTLKQARERTRQRTHPQPTLSNAPTDPPDAPTRSEPAIPPADLEDRDGAEQGNIGAKLLNRRRKNSDN